MNASRRLLFGSLSAVFAIVGGLLLLLQFTSPAKGDPTPNPPSAAECLQQSLHTFAADAGKTAPDNYGPPVGGPNRIDLVEPQFDDTNCKDMLILQSSRWHLATATAPRNAAEINKHASWAAKDAKLRAADYADFRSAAFGDSTGRDIVQVPKGTTYWTLAAKNVGGTWSVYQTQVTLSHTEPMLEVTTANGAKKLFKLSCHFQPVSPEEFPGVPVGPPPGGPSSPPPSGGYTPPPGTTPTTPQGGKVDNHPVGNPLPGGAGGPQAGNTDTTPDTEDPDGTHHGSSGSTGCHGGCTGGTPTTTRPVPPSTVETTPVTVPAPTASTTVPGP